MKRIVLLSKALIISTLILAQKQAPENWFNLDYKTNKVYGVSTEKAYKELLRGKQAKPVIVAVIDGGTEVNHADLNKVIWVNTGEKPGNNQDDDKNGYIDDINGWSFIGGADSNVVEDTYEYTRIYGKYKPMFEDANGNAIGNTNSKEYALYLKAKNLYEKSLKAAKGNLQNIKNLKEGVAMLIKNSGKQSPTEKDLAYFKPSNDFEKMQLRLAKLVVKTGGIEKSPILGSLDGAAEYYQKQLKYYLNTSFDPRPIVGDIYNEVSQRYYGSNYVSGPKGEHGTHVAGIIAAIRNNGIGMDGVCDAAQIMVLRVVPDGDERDKDIANAIRYASDNGAKIINMSFGKALSPNKNVIDEAVKYALSKDVLLVHAAGNDHKNIDVEDNFPTAVAEDGAYTAPNWIEVGASSWKTGKYVTADFSNYGKSKVDVFAPGVDIYSCVPESEYDSYSGTSMAAPVTAGVAALLRAYYPHLTAVQTQEIILKSAVVYKKKVLIPGTKKKVKLNELCKTGGIVNAYEAIKLAETYKK